MTKNQMQKWTKALRSGKFKQGQYRLKDLNTYCCLGVLCKINNLSTVGTGLSEGAKRFFKVSTHNGTLKKSYKAKNGGRCRSLASLNDRGLSFKQIANIIEKNYKDL